MTVRKPANRPKKERLVIGIVPHLARLEARRVAADLHAIDDAARLAAAQEALRWVAKNLNDLWD